MLMERKKKSRFGIVKDLYNGTSSAIINETKARRTNYENRIRIPNTSQHICTGDFEITMSLLNLCKSYGDAEVFQVFRYRCRSH